MTIGFLKINHINPGVENGQGQDPIRMTGSKGKPYWPSYIVHHQMEVF